MLMNFLLQCLHSGLTLFDSYYITGKLCQCSGCAWLKNQYRHATSCSIIQLRLSLQCSLIITAHKGRLADTQTPLPLLLYVCVCLLITLSLSISEENLMKISLWAGERKTNASLDLVFTPLRASWEREVWDAWKRPWDRHQMECFGICTAFSAQRRILSRPLIISGLQAASTDCRELAWSREGAAPADK